MFVLLKLQYLGRMNILHFLYLYIEYISPSFVIIPLFAAFYRYRYLTPAFKLLLWYYIYLAISNVVNITLPKYHIHTVFLYHIFTIFEFSFITLFYNIVFEKKWNNIMIPMIVVFNILCIINFFIQSGDKVDTYTSTLEAVIVIGYCILYLLRQNNVEEDTTWGRNGLNWVNISFMLYYSCGLFMFISTNFLMNAGLTVNLIVYSVFDAILVSQFLLAAVGFYKCKT
jgi:hypothetical protein